MRERRPSALNLSVLLDAVEAAPPVAAADVVGRALGEAVGARDVSFLIADYGGQSLVRLSHIGLAQPEGNDTSRERTDALPLLGTAHGRAIMEQQAQVARTDHEWQVIVPVTSRGEAVGALELLLDVEPDEPTIAQISSAAHALAYIVIANRRVTDLFEWGQRSIPLSLEAEIQHRLVPASNTCEGGQFTLAAWLEPAGDVGGDTFDFSVERDTLHLSITDAMGHTVEAALLATLLVGASRNARRIAATLRAQAALANASLRRYAESGAFVTGQLARVDLRSGVVRIVNAGHPAPRLVRDGQAVTVTLDTDPPFGVEPDTPYRVQELPLRQGDRLVFVTDGMLERDASAVNVAAILSRTCDLHPREAVQELTRAVVRAAGGTLRDDATVLCVDWHGGSTIARTTQAGTDH